MSGTWAGARANIKAQIDGLEITSPVVETMAAFEYPPDGRQGAESLPYAFILPPPQRVTREPGQQRITDISEITVVVILAGPDAGNSRETLAKRHDAWVEKLKDAFDDAVSLDGNVDVVLSQNFSGEQPFPFEGNRWGFEMTIEVMLSETKTVTA